MPQLAIVTPPVPPMMISSAGMSMKAAGLVPPMIPAIRMPIVATTIPIAVAGFISFS